jgi:hypothetical protein
MICISLACVSNSQFSLGLKTAGVQPRFVQVRTWIIYQDGVTWRMIQVCNEMYVRCKDGGELIDSFLKMSVSPSANVVLPEQGNVPGARRGCKVRHIRNG